MKIPKFYSQLSKPHEYIIGDSSECWASLRSAQPTVLNDYDCGEVKLALDGASLVQATLLRSYKV
jgi:hypothetical protein